jgi:hypothetical protein
MSITTITLSHDLILWGIPMTNMSVFSVLCAQGLWFNLVIALLGIAVLLAGAVAAVLFMFRDGHKKGRSVRGREAAAGTPYLRSRSARNTGKGKGKVLMDELLQ